METGTGPWKLGLFVVTGAALAVAAVLWMGARTRHEVLTIHCFFDEPVTGLDVGSPVRHRGVTIGTVSDVRLAAEDPSREWIRVDMDIYRDVLVALGRIPTGARGRDIVEVDETAKAAKGERVWRARLSSSMLTGLSSIETDLYDPRTTPKPDYPFTPPPRTLHTMPSRGRKLEQDLERVMDAVPPVAEKLKETLGNVDQALLDLRPRELSSHLDRLLADADRALTALDAPALSKEATTTLARARDAFAATEALANDLRREDGALHRLADVYARLGEEMRKEIARADVPLTLETARTALERIASLATKTQRLAGDFGNELSYVRRMVESLAHLADTLESDPAALLRGRRPAPPPAKE
jgi:ABC-type transporter Mla subunit MlaD